MEEFYYNIITFLATLDPLVKALIVGMLAVLVILCVRNIVKTHVNPKKAIFKFGQFFLLAVLVALTIFICVNVF